MKVIYIAGPITASSPEIRQKNIEYACKRAAYYWNQGYSVICPHANTKNVEDYTASNFDDTQWLKGGLEQLHRCDAIVLLPNWESSYGSKQELRVAIENNLEIIIDRELTNQLQHLEMEATE